MHWFEIGLIMLVGLETLGDISAIGLRREPVTVHAAMFSFVMNSLLVWGLIHFWGR